MAALLCAGALLVGLFVALPMLQRPAASNPSEAIQPEELLAITKDGAILLRTGKPRLAVVRLGEAVQLRDRVPNLLTPEQHRELNQLHRQADLLARLSPLSLETIVRHGKLLRDPHEWKAQLADHRGKTFIFDDHVRRDREGKPILTSHVYECDGEPIRVALDDLILLRDLPLDMDTRLIFGARLDNCQREEGGGWVVRFVPDSGVLLTELAIVETCLGVAAEDVADILATQQQYLDERRIVPPARP